MLNKIDNFFYVYLSNELGDTKFVIDLAEIMTCSAMVTALLYYFTELPVVLLRI